MLGESNKEDNRVDLLAKLTTGEIVLIEVQVNTESDYLCRLEDYLIRWNHLFCWNSQQRHISFN